MKKKFVATSEIIRLLNKISLQLFIQSIGLLLLAMTVAILALAFLKWAA